jgi:hypothetical protein
MSNEVIDFLVTHGECTMPEMPFPKLKRRTLISQLSRMYEKGVIDRRMVTTPKGELWAYTAIQGPDRPYQFRNESDSVYFLRNLPRENFLQKSISLLEESHDQL